MFIQKHCLLGSLINKSLLHNKKLVAFPVHALQPYIVISVIDDTDVKFKCSRRVGIMSAMPHFIRNLPTSYTEQQQTDQRTD